MSTNRKSHIAQLAGIGLVASLGLPLGRLRAAAPPQVTPTIQVSVGEPLSEVEAALNIHQKPSKAPSAVRVPETQVRLPQRGVWIFVGPGNQVLQYRFDAPFSGNIEGTRIGDSVAQIQAVLGSPVRSILNFIGESYLYRTNSTVVRCDFDRRGILQTIRVLGGTIALTESRSEGTPADLAPRAVAPIVTTQGRITRLTIPGSLAVTQELPCIKLKNVNSTMTPPDLYAAVPRCLAENRYTDAVKLFAFAGVEASFDALRLTDKTAGQARQVLIMNTVYPLPPEQRRRFGETFKAFVGNPRAFADLCARVQQIAPPSYYPRYMILHGIRAFRGDPYKHALVAHFDAQRTWIQVQHKYLNCPLAH